MSKRTLLLVLALVVSVAIAATGTLAYLTATDSDVNVMTLGNVEIRQLEMQRTDDFKNSDNGGHSGLLEDGGLEPFVDGKLLYPAYPAGGDSSYETDAANPLYWGDYVTADNAANSLWDDEKLVGVVDKMVFVENTGSSPAYYRTILAFECPEGLEFSEDGSKELMMNISDNDLFLWEEHGYVTLDDGQRYLVMSATWQQALEPGEICTPSLLQVVMTHNADSSDVAALGETYEIIALSQAVQTTNLPDATTALEAAFPDLEANVELWLGDALAADAEDHWDGSADTSWYNDTDSEFTITTAEQLAGLRKLVDEGNTFEGKTIKLGSDLCLGNGCDSCAKDGEEPLSFDPIGSYRNNMIFKGTFDGQDHAIKNMQQNTWALDNGYYYGDLGLGLFAYLEDATICNLVMDGASISGESALCGTVAATAYGDTVFENITVINSNVADYQYYAGGIVGWASGNQQYLNCDIDESTVIGGQWGDFNNRNGGIIGGTGTSGTYHFKDCDVSCVIDAFNDVVSAYEWYSYRNCGMLIGSTGYDQEIDGTTYAAAPNVTCENVTVTYNDWANYTYCHFGAMGYPWVRAQAGISSSAYSNIRYGQPTDADGNTVTDENHAHSADEPHHELIVFDQLFGGPGGDRYCTYGWPTHDGVTVVYNNR